MAVNRPYNNITYAAMTYFLHVACTHGIVYVIIYNVIVQVFTDISFVPINTTT